MLILYNFFLDKSKTSLNNIKKLRSFDNELRLLSSSKLKSGVQLKLTSNFKSNSLKNNFYNSKHITEKKKKLIFLLRLPFLSHQKHSNFNLQTCSSVQQKFDLGAKSKCKKLKGRLKISKFIKNTGVNDRSIFEQSNQQITKSIFFNFINFNKFLK